MFCTQSSVTITGQYKKYGLLRYIRLLHVVNLPITKVLDSLKKTSP